MEEGYYKTKDSVLEYIKLAKDVNGILLINTFASFIPKNSKVLEIGSGPGTDWKILSENFQVTGSDNSQVFLDHLTKSNPTGKFIQLDAKVLDTNEMFDGIYSNKVLHHLTDQELIDSISNSTKILNKNSIICHSFWKGQGSEIFKGLFVNYHSKKDIERYFAKKFDILVLEEYKEFEDNDSLVLLARKK